MKLLITGSKGMLATDLIKELQSENEIIGVDIEELDICKIDDVMSFVKEAKPDILVNCAGYTNVDGCETDVEKAYKINAIGTRNLAVACNEIQIPIVHFSTDYVFDGLSDKSYLENDCANPLSVYGKSKLEGEELIKTLTTRYFIVRTQWLYGKNGNNFIKTIVRLAKEKGSLKVVDDQFGSPTYTKDLSVAIKTLIKTKSFGTYHITNSGITTWYGFTKEILKLTNLSHVKLEACTTDEFLRPAKRPLYAPLKNFYWEMIGNKPLRHYEEALKDYIAEEYNIRQD